MSHRPAWLVATPPSSGRGRAGERDIPSSPRSCPRSSAAWAGAHPGAEGLGTRCSRLPTTSIQSQHTGSPQGHFWPQKFLPVGQGTCSNTGPAAGHLGLLQREQVRGKPRELQAGVSWGPGMSEGQGATTPAGTALSRALTWGPLLKLESESPNGQKCSSQNAQNRKRKKYSSGPIRRWLPKGVGWQDPAQAQARRQRGGHSIARLAPAGRGDLTPSLNCGTAGRTAEVQAGEGGLSVGGVALPPP